MKLVNTFFLVFFAYMSLTAAHLDSSWTIVIPKPGGDSILDRFNREAAELFARGAQEAADLTLPVVTEDQYKTGKAVFIGNTSAAQKQGINPETLPFQACAVQTDGEGNLYFSGRHSINPEYAEINQHRFRELGTLRGVCEFLREYAGMRVFLPHAVHFRKKNHLEFPDHFKTVYTPVFSYVLGKPSNDCIYDAANGFLFAPWYKTYGGHSHDHAVPKSLFKEHPEYFAMLKNGKRWASTHLCLSNPEVQELIYREMLKRLDKGFQWVQLGQTDGFFPCCCESCNNLYGLSDWGEKLWILHKNMAERLKKDRPGKMAVILCYGPTSKTPASFQEFPDNVIVELCHYTEDALREWQKIKVPGGLCAYVYNWGAYAPESYSPRFTPEKAVGQIKLLHKYGIRAIYRCGFGEMYGLEGPCYYAYGAAVDNPEDADAEKIMDDYCNTLYGRSAIPMKQFYRMLYDCQKKMLSSRHDDYSVRLGSLMPAGYANHRLLSLRYPEETLDSLNRLLKQAETSEPGNQYITLVRREFDFLAVTARMCMAFCRYIDAPSSRTFEAMKHGVEARNLYLKNSLQVRGHMIFIAGVEVLGGIQIRILQDGGSYKGKFVYPLNWDLDFLQKEQILPGARKLKCGAPAQKLLPAFFGPVKEEMMQVRAEMQENGLNVIISDPHMVEKNMYQVMLDKTIYVFRSTYRYADIYEKKSNGTTGVKEGMDKKLTRITRNGDELICFIPREFLPKGKTAPFNLYVQKDNARLYIYEPDIRVLNGRHSVADGRAVLEF